MTPTDLPAGLVCVGGARGYADTLSHLEATLAEQGVTVFARVDHAEAARAAGLALAPTVVLIVGAATAGAPLMSKWPRLALDLPLRILVREVTPGGPAELCFNDPAWVASRHGVDPETAPQLARMRAALGAAVAAAAGPP